MRFDHTVQFHMQQFAFIRRYTAETYSIVYLQHGGGNYYTDKMTQLWLHVKMISLFRWLLRSQSTKNAEMNN